MAAYYFGGLGAMPTTRRTSTQWLSYLVNNKNKNQSLIDFFFSCPITFNINNKKGLYGTNKDNRLHINARAFEC